MSVVGANMQCPGPQTGQRRDRSDSTSLESPSQSTSAGERGFQREPKRRKHEKKRKDKKSKKHKRKGKAEDNEDLHASNKLPPQPLSEEQQFLLDLEQRNTSKKTTAAKESLRLDPQLTNHNSANADDDCKTKSSSRRSSQQRSLAPMTAEDYRKRQEKVREVFDPGTLLLGQISLGGGFIVFWDSFNFRFGENQACQGGR